MAKKDFPIDEFLERRDRVRAEMQRQKLDWLLVFNPVSIHWLTGSDAKSYQEFQCLFITQTDGRLRLLTREGKQNECLEEALLDEIWTWGGRAIEDPLEVFQRVSRPLGLFKSQVGMEVPAYYLHPHDYVRLRDLLGSALVAEPTNLIPDLKLVKSRKELEYIRQAAQLADKAMDIFAGALRIGRTELEVAGDVYAALLHSGSGLAASPMNLVSGERSAFSHGAPTLRRLQSGDFGSVEYGATWRRYTATIGRQFCLGAPSSRMRQLYEVVREASDACRAAIRDGVPAYIPHQAAKRVIEKAGLERGRVHTTGYGIAPGFPPTWGEPLHLLEGSSYVLREGMVVTIEPPVFLGEERLGARLIDNVLVTKTGCELLTRYSRDLILMDDKPPHE